MAGKLSAYDFLERARSLPVVDVRSPKEFAQGHIPGAFSIPLFDDEERAVVGTTYTRNGNQEAILKGLEIVGPKLQQFASQGQRLAKEGDILVHCWRGGMRSEAMAWLFDFSGLKTGILEGGYKAYRHFIRSAFESGPPLHVLGGMTGTGKTELLRQLKCYGEQVIDLEGLAHHKGSAFGALGETEQPTTEQFENDLAKEWIALDPDRPVWVEDESLNVGKVVIPDVFFKQMQSSLLFFIDMPFQSRVDRLLNDYGSFDHQALIEVIGKISKRMGGEQAKLATDSLINNDIRKAIETVLQYYDKTYSYSLKKREKESIQVINSEDFEDLKALAEHLAVSKLKTKN